MITTPLEDIPKIHESLHKTFSSRLTFPIAWRQHQLLQIARMLQDNHQRFADAVSADFGKPSFEFYLTEINAMIDRAIKSAERLPEWAAPKELNNHPDLPDWQKSWTPRTTPTPKGAVLIISPWNYPLHLSVQGVIGAIAAGCTVCLKLSEVTTNFAGVLQETMSQYVDPNAVKIVCGGVPVVSKVLEQKWDHIFYTGNGTIARIISAAAAKHLTPLTLELGGKSPVIIDADCHIELAAKRVLWGKITNAGQICVAPDYVLIPPAVVERFTQGLKDAYAAFYPQGSLKSDSYGRIMNMAHFNRLKDVLNRTKGKVLMGGGMDEKERRIEPTVVLVKPGDALLEAETFGPILALVEIEDTKAACDWISAGDHPLVVYFFSDNEKLKLDVRRWTMSGNLVYNDTFMQMDVKVLPFGGVGESGYGRQVLQHTFDVFSYDRSSVDIPLEAEAALSLRYPPYTQQNFEIMCGPGLNVVVPASTPEKGLSSKE